MDMESMRRVDHAGEWGAVHIYTGQLWVFPNDPDIAHMLEQEKEHLAAFNKQLIKHQTRPSWLQPAWALGGLALGAVTALMGKRMAHTCTVAVEEVIEEHYAEQLRELDGQDDEFAKIVEKFAAEEAEHRSIASEAIQHKPYPIASWLIRSLTRAAIAVAKKV